MSILPSNFAVFILTHGRPHSVITYHTLRRQGYTGPVYLLVDNEDVTLPAYREQYGEQVIVFDKQAVAAATDEADNFQDRRAVIYARNASFDVARTLGLDYFLQLDDDYLDFRFNFNARFEWGWWLVKRLDRLFSAMLAFYQAVPAITVALSQTGDFIGGGQNSRAARPSLGRKAMNTFFCATARSFQFMGRVNEDVNTYVCLGRRGELFLTVYQAAINQVDSQQQRGGMTELYQAQGTYWKAFYTVMYAPSCTRVSVIGTLHRRIHHRISWDNAVPKLLPEDVRKPREQPHA